jgi:hypothetical protein
VSAAYQRHVVEAAIRARIEVIAADVARLTRRFHSNGAAWTGISIIERLADSLELLAAMLEPTAAELAAVYASESGDEQLAVEEALHVVDERTERLRRLLEEQR